MIWKILSTKKILQTRPFALEEVMLSKNGTTLNHPYTRITPPDWVNILPIDKDGNCIMIEQYRVGSDSIVLEIPGGVVDPEDLGNMHLAAARELEEETGYSTNEIIPLGSINPNPAIQTNKVHFFLGLNCQPKLIREHFPDSDEDIKIRLIPKSQLPDLVRSSKMDHCLSALCVLLAEKYL